MAALNETVYSQQEIEKTTQQTKEALEKILNVGLTAAIQSQDSAFIKYKPSHQSAAFSSGAKERIIRIMEMQVDPLEPPKFKQKRVPTANGSSPVTVMHSPPRPVTVKDQEEWEIPPCVSNWKNAKGYTIPVDKRLSRRGLEEVRINDSFAKLSEALYAGEQRAREAVSMRAKVRNEMLMKEKERKENELCILAQKARSERTETGPSSSPGKDQDQEREERVKRERMREERRRERERGKKSKITRDQDQDRDISEKVALSMALTGPARGEVMYDQRLFNQEKGMGSGFATDDQYNIYDKGLFTAQPALYTLCRPNKDGDDEMYATDPFGLDRCLTEVTGEKNPLGKISSGGGSRGGYEGSGRTRIGFETGK